MSGCLTADIANRAMCLTRRSRNLPAGCRASTGAPAGTNPLRKQIDLIWCTVVDADMAI